MIIDKLEDKKNKKNKYTPTGPLMRRIIKNYVRPHLRTIFVAVFFMILAAAMTGGLAKLMEPIIDEVFSAKDKAKLVPVAAAVFFAFAIRGGATYAHTVLMNKVGQAVIAKVQKEMFSHLMNMDLAFFHKTTSGHLITRMVSDVTVMRGAVTDSITGIAKSALTLVILLGVMFYQDWRLTIASVFVFPLAAFFVAKIGKKLRRVSTHMQEEMGEFSSLLNQNFQAVRYIRAYDLEQQEKNRINKVIDKLYRLYCKAVRVSALATPMSEILSGIAIVTIIIYGGIQVVEGTTTPGKLFSFITAFLLAYEPMKRLAKMNTVLQTGLAAAERVFDVIDKKPSIVDKKNAKELMLKKAPTVSFDKVSFTYPTAEEDKCALKNISFKIPAGKTVALVGASGSGKTTIINLLLRFYDIEHGNIKISDNNIKNIKLKSLYNNIAIVSQDVTIFNDSVLDNIRASCLHASDEDVKNAAKAALAHDFIQELPDGYNTKLGEQGLKLSGGQRQRIAIARAMLKNAPLLLLDEATSALDNNSEQIVQKALNKLQHGRTTLIVAHRLSTIKNADIIYVMEAGEIIEIGNHEELLKINGIYAKLYGKG